MRASPQNRSWSFSKILQERIIEIIQGSMATEKVLLMAIQW
jgi:hypothetical protein